MQKNVIVGTAGHVDHGKTTLIKALTGEDTDRLEEEKQRGLSIDLGFSYLQLADNLQLGIVDVPGHEKFIKNMLAGAGGVDIGLLVVAADEAVRPQTREHLVILELLGVKQGVIAVTKTDLVTDEWLELVVEEIKEEVADTFLANASVVLVSSVTGQGLADLQCKLASTAEKIPPKNKAGAVYLPIDRVFTLSGLGTIVTGTLKQGTITVGEQVEIYPSKYSTRVRNLQVHGSDVETVYPGQRVGINLADLAVEDINRGDKLAADNSLVPTDYLDARLQLLPTAPLTLNPGDRIRLHLGAKEVMGRVYLLDKPELQPGETGLVQFHVEETVAARYQEKYVLRRYSPLATIGGGEILAINPSRHSQFDQQIVSELKIKADGSKKERIKLAFRSSDAPLFQDELAKLSHLTNVELKDCLSLMETQGEAVKLAVGHQARWISRTDYEQLKQEVIKKLNFYHQTYHLRGGMNKEELRTKLGMSLTTNEYDLLVKDLQQNNQVKVSKGELKLADFEIKLTSKEKEIRQALFDLLLENQFAPPEKDELINKAEKPKLAAEIFNLLVRRKKIIKLTESLYFHYQAVSKAEQILKDYLRDEETIRLAQFRDLLGTSRKYTLPLLEYFDKLGITVRRGNYRKLLTES